MSGTKFHPSLNQGRFISAEASLEETDLRRRTRLVLLYNSSSIILTKELIGVICIHDVFMMQCLGYGEVKYE